jgi:hypothetical protein
MGTKDLKFLKIVVTEKDLFSFAARKGAVARESSGRKVKRLNSGEG